MSIIGPEINERGIGLFNWFWKQKGEILGYRKVLWSGITTLELAKGIDAAIKQDLKGLYHLVPDENISKYDLLNLFKEVFSRKDITVSSKDDIATNKTLINTRKDFDFKVLDYRAMIDEMKNWIDSHKTLYKHYK